jgi:hypothetical protein
MATFRSALTVMYIVNTHALDISTTHSVIEVEVFFTTLKSFDNKVMHVNLSFTYDTAASIDVFIHLYGKSIYCDICITQFAIMHATFQYKPWHQ